MTTRHLPGVRSVDLVVAAATFVLAIASWHGATAGLLVAVAGANAAAVVLRRPSPLGSLGLVTLGAVGQALMLPELSSAVFGTLVAIAAVTASGSRRTVRIVFLVTLVGGVVAPVLLNLTGSTLAVAVYGVTTVKGVIVASAPLVVLLGAWLAGVARQAIRDSRIERRRRATAEAHATQADQVAADEAQRSHLAREVHDLVGHSLAVIVAQADSIRFLRDADAIREAAGAIGATARASLVEVREVLSRTGADVRYPGSEDLDAVIRQVSDAGVPLRDEHEGAAVAMDEASAHAARRVLQEMLTNALKHGRSDTVISVRRVWTGEALQVTVSNEVLRPERPLAERGLGIVGMRRRMAELGGTFRSAVVDDRYEASASFPLHPDASSGAA